MSEASAPFWQGNRDFDQRSSRTARVVIDAIAPSKPLCLVNIGRFGGAAGASGPQSRNLRSAKTE